MSDNNTLSTPNKRRKYIMLKILFKSPNPCVITDLFEDYYLSASSIRNDIAIIESYMNRRGVTIEKDNLHIKTIGEEEVIRKVINQLLIDVEDISDYNNILNEISGKFKNSEDLKFITQQIDFLEERLEKEIPYPYDINLVIHMYILLKRFKDGNVNFKYDIEYKELYLPNNEKVAVRECLKNISEYLNSDIPSSEYNYLGKYISSAGIVNREKTPEDLSCKMTNYYIDSYFDTNINKVDKKQLFGNLILHLEPMIYRITNDIEIKNTLLFEIKNEYHDLYTKLKKISRKAEKEFNLKSISEDEIGYLAVYFAKYKEISKNNNKRILIVCSSGVGTSEFLKVKVRNTFPSLKIIGVHSARKVEKEFYKYSDIDLILTTVDLNREIDIPTILVSSLFTIKDQERVNNFFEGELINE